MRWCIGFGLGMTLVGITTPAIGVEVYFNDFETGDCLDWPEWSVCAEMVSPNASERFLGEFGLGNNLTTLTLSNLPPHSEVTLSFDLYIICTWDGNNQHEAFELRADGQSLMHVTFDNAGHTQSYPAPIGQGDNPSGTGAYATNTLGYDCDHPPFDDATYRFPNADWSFTVPHTGSEITIEFEGFTNQPIPDESWGLDNVRVEVDCVEQLIARCQNNKLLGKIVTDAPAGTVYRLTADNAFYREKGVAPNGNATMTWTNPVPGVHEVCVDGCDICETVECP